MNNLNKVFFMVAALLCAGCTDYEYVDSVAGSGSAHLHISVNAYEFVPFGTRSSLSLKDVSSRMSYAFFQMDGETKVMQTKSVTSDDANYGNMEVRLEPGEYIMVTVAHNGTGNCTISSPTEVKFTSNHTTDTFTSCDTIAVSEGEQSAYISLVRRVAMFRLILEEKVAPEVKRIKFYYTGGSSTLDASTGFGSINSRQTEVIEVPASAYTTPNSVFEVYTFPHESTGTLKMSITALDAEGNTVVERDFQNVPIRQREITQYRGILTGESVKASQFNISIDDADWTQTDHQF